MIKLLCLLFILMCSLAIYADDDRFETFDSASAIGEPMVIISADCQTIGYNGKIYHLVQNPKEEELERYPSEISNNTCKPE